MSTNSDRIATPEVTGTTTELTTPSAVGMPTTSTQDVTTPDYDTQN